VAASDADEKRYVEPRAHALRERYLQTFGGPEIPVPVESIAEDLLGLRIERAEMDCSGMLLPTQRLIRILIEAQLAQRTVKAKRKAPRKLARPSARSGKRAA